MSNVSLFNEIAELFLDGRLDGIVGNTLSQKFFGNNIESIIGQGIEFNIDWIGYYFQGNTVNDVISLLNKIAKNPALDMHSGFFAHTVGDQVELHSNGKLYDFYRGLSTDKTEFAFDATTCTPDEQALLALEPYIDFIFWFNMLTCIATQALAIYSGVISENDTEGESYENATMIINIMNLIIYFTVPLVNSIVSKLITEVEIIFAGFKKDETEDAKAESAFNEVENKVKTLEQQVATLLTQTADNVAAIATIKTQVDTAENNRADQEAYQAYVNGDWNEAMDLYRIELAEYNAAVEEYQKKQAALKSSTFRQVGSWLGKKAYNPENYQPPTPPVKPPWTPPNIVKFPNAPA